MAAYFITDFVVLDPEQFQKYREQVRPTVEVHGGKYVVAGNVTTLEGRWDTEGIVVVEFPTVEKAREWYSTAYAPLMALRARATNSTFAVLASER